MRIRILSMTSLALLSACGGSGTERVIDILTTDDTVGGVSVLGSTNAAGTEIILDTPEGVITVPIGSFQTVGIFAGGFEQTSSEFTFGLVAEGEASVATIGAYGPIDDARSGVSFQRTVYSTLPTSGGATFTGDYVGVLVRESGTPISGYGVTGVATLTANFNQSTVSGIISERAPGSVLGEVEAIAGASSTDVLLGETAITDQGTFSSTTSGGAISDPRGLLGDSTAFNGSFSGLFAGQEAAEAVGGLEVPHSIRGTTYSELGVFSAKQ